MELSEFAKEYPDAYRALKEETVASESKKGFSMDPIFETKEEILDTIAVCKVFLEDASKITSAVFKHLFSDEAVAFAKGQIKFEEAKLTRLANLAKGA